MGRVCCWLSFWLQEVFLQALRFFSSTKKQTPASFPVVLGDFGCDVTCHACRENSPPPRPPITFLMVRPLLYLYYNLLRVCSHCTRQLWRRDENHSRQGFCSGIRTVISTRHSVRSNWNLEVFVQPRTQACSRYPSDQRRLGTERDRRIFPTSLTGDVTWLLS